MSMLTPLSSTARAQRDTIIGYADAKSLDVLGQLFGLSRPGVLDHEAWRKVLRAAVYGPKGTRGNMFEVLEGAWTKQYAVNYVCTVHPANPTILTWVSGGPVAGFDKRNVNRLYRIVWSKGSHIFQSRGPAFTAGPPTTTELLLNPFETAYWKAANWAVLGQQETVQVAMLPFVWADYDAIFELAASIDGGAPPTYLQPQVRWGAKGVGDGMPNAQATLVASDTSDLPQWQQDAPAGIESYVVTAQTAGTWRNLIVNADHDPNNPGAAVNRGGAYDITLLKKTAGVWGPTALTCQLGAQVKTASDLTHAVALAAGDEVALFWAADNAVNKPAFFAKASVYIDPPNGMPAGGFLMPNAAAPDVGGPLYLSSKLDAETLAALRHLLAAGVRLKDDLADFAVKDGYW